MLTLVTGGSASGKSEYAEQLAVALAHGAPLYYIATMQPFGAEGAARIARHHKLRAGKGFTTIECYTGLAGVIVPQSAVVLVECLTNLAANELFSPGGAGHDAQREILRGVQCLCAQAAQVVAVSGEVFSDGLDYDEGTRRYLRLLGAVNRGVAARAARVVEVVYTIPLVHKNEEERKE